MPTPTMPLPMIAWPASGPSGFLNFTYPPIEKPMPQGNEGDEIEGVRVDSITVSGLRQSMYYRTDEFKHLIMKFVPIVDIDNWKAFIQYAVQGGSFLYYPDSTGSTYDEWWMEDLGGSARSQMGSGSGSANWNPKYSFRTMAEFELVMRKVPGGLSAP